MKQINLLIVEDKEDQIDSWNTAIVQFNRLAERNDDDIFKFYAEFSKNHDEAKLKLNTYSFETAVVDIRLTEDELGYEDTSGNEVIKDILNNSICLITVYTGQSIDVVLSDEQKDFISIVDKSAKTKREVLASITDQKELVNSIIDIKKTFRQSKASLFYSSIWPRWKFWLEEKTSAIENQAALKRHMATHLHATFLNEVTEVHPEEHYFIPPLTDKLDTGDITLVDDKHYILITPRCEVAQDKHETWQFVELKDISPELKSYDLIISKSATKTAELVAVKPSLALAVKEAKAAVVSSIKAFNTAKTELGIQLKIKTNSAVTEHVKINEVIVGKSTVLLNLENEKVSANKVFTLAETNLNKNEAEIKSSTKKETSAKSKKQSLFKNNKASLHFLPEIKQSNEDHYGPFYAQFDQLVFINKVDLNLLAKYKDGKYSSLSNEFVPSLVERLGAYFSRIGTPDYSHPE